MTSLSLIMGRSGVLILFLFAAVAAGASSAALLAAVGAEDAIETSPEGSRKVLNEHERNGLIATLVRASPDYRTSSISADILRNQLQGMNNAELLRKHSEMPGEVDNELDRVSAPGTPGGHQAVVEEAERVVADAEKMLRDMKRWKEEERDAADAEKILGCDVCATPDVFNFEMPSETAANVVCQSFWHKHYADWKACRAAALIERAAFRRELCSRCTAQADSASPPASLLQPPTRGIAFGVTGTGVAYIKMIAVAIVQLRSPLIGYSEGIEVFVDSEPLRELCVKVIAPHGAKCKILTVKVRIGFAAKLIAARESSFDEVMMLDADTLFVMNPSALFNDAAFRMHGVLMWSDYFGNG